MMIFSHKRYAVMAVLCITIAAAFSEENIQSFDNKFSLSVLSKYNFVQFLYDDSKTAQSNRPVDIGFKFSYKNLTLGFNICIPFTYSKEYNESASLDIQLNYCNDYVYTEAVFKYYDGFHSGNNAVVLELFSGGFFGEYILNKNHSLRSVYALDRLQTVSNGSLLLGGNFFATSIESSEIESYVNKTAYMYFGPNAGYSYTWVLENNYFINIFLVLGADLCVTNTQRYSFTPHMLSKFSVGKHNNLWSINFELEANYVSFSEKFIMPDSLFNSSACVTVTRRF
jgi:hypothetical protein